MVKYLLAKRLVVIAVGLLMVVNAGSLSAQSPAIQLTWRVAWSPTGTQIAAIHIVDGFGDGNDIVAIYDAQTEQQIGTLPIDDQTNQTLLENIAWRSDGMQLAVVRSQENVVLDVWDVSQMPYQRIFTYDTEIVTGEPHVDWHPSTNLIAILTEYDVHIIDPSSGSLVNQFPLPEVSAPNWIEWSPDGTRVLIGGAPGLLMDPMTGGVIARLQDNEPVYFKPFAWSPNGELIVAHYGDVYRVWDVTTLSPIQTLSTEIDDSIDIEWIGDVIVASKINENTEEIVYWNSNTFQFLGTTNVGLQPIYDIALHPDGSQIAYGTDDTTTLNIMTFPLAHAGPDQTLTDSDANGTELATLDGSASTDPDGTIVSYDWQENGTTIAVGSNPEVELAVGTHTITLVVTDNDGLVDMDEVLITIEAAPSPTATPQPPAECNFTINTGDVQGLIDAINYIKTTEVEDAPQPNTICLHEGTYTLTTVDNTAAGANGLPAITEPITIKGLGNGATLARDPAAPDFRLFYVTSNGQLALDNLTLQQGRARGTAESGYGWTLYQMPEAVTLLTTPENRIYAPLDWSWD